jgi:hypothetical protein
MKRQCVDASRKRIAWRVAQAVAFAAIVILAWKKLAPQWSSIAAAFGDMHVRAAPLLLSAVLVIAGYAVLIETWRRVVSAWGSSLSFGAATRIWLISNLGRYVPGKITSITAMGAMAHNAGVSPVAAVGSSVLINVVNIFAGGAVILLTASDTLPLPQWAVLALSAGAIAVALLPRFLPSTARWLAARFKREVSWPAIPYHTTLIAYAGCAVAWVLYGLAFQFLVSATVGPTAGATRYYIAIYTASYLAGFLTLFAAGGLGVRETAMIPLLTKYGMATLAGATVIAVASRLWLLVIELLPGLILLAFSPKVSTTIPNAKSRTL